MKKIINLFVLMCFILTSTSVFAMPNDFSAIAPTHIEVSTTSDNLKGMGQWLGYFFSIILIIFTIVKVILMLKNKKPISKVLLFALIMAVVIWLLAYGVTLLGWM